MGKKIVTKTAAEAKMEREKLDTNDICPECGTQALIAFEGEEHKEGFFLRSIIKYSYYSCNKCGCEWKVEKGRWEYVRSN